MYMILAVRIEFGDGEVANGVVGVSVVRPADTIRKLLVTATAEVVDTSEMIGPVKVAVELAA
jgi:hypothetical protein